MFNVPAVAKALSLSSERVRQLVKSGELVPDEWVGRSPLWKTLPTRRVYIGTGWPN